MIETAQISVRLSHGSEIVVPFHQKHVGGLRELCVHRGPCGDFRSIFVVGVQDFFNIAIPQTFLVRRTRLWYARSMARIKPTEFRKEQFSILVPSRPSQRPLHQRICFD